MRALDVAHRYLTAFFAGDLESLHDLLADNLVFEGPFFQGDSAKAYMDALRESVPKAMKYHILNEFDSANEACVIYQFCKADVSTPMAQYFEVQGKKITKIRLIFDSAAF